MATSEATMEHTLPIELMRHASTEEVVLALHMISEDLEPQRPRSHLRVEKRYEGTNLYLGISSLNPNENVAIYADGKEGFEHGHTYEHLSVVYKSEGWGRPSPAVAPSNRMIDGMLQQVKDGLENLLL